MRFSEAAGGLSDHNHSASGQGGTLGNAILTNAMMNATGGHNVEIKFKAANEAVNNSTTLQADDDLVTSTLVANAVYCAEFRLTYIGAGATDDIKFDLSIPASAEFKMTGIGLDTADAVQLFNCIDGGSAPRLGSYGTSGAVYRTVVIYGTILLGATAGTVSLTWAQNTATVGNTTLQANNTSLLLRRIK